MAYRQNHTAQPSYVRPVARRSRSRQRRSWGVFLMGLVALVLLIVTAGLVGGALLYSGELIPPGMQSLGIALGGQSRSAAARRLEQAWNSHTVIIDLGGMQKPVRPEDLGVSLDITATVRLAYDEGRSSTSLAQMLRDRRLALEATDIQPVWRFDAGTADQTLQALARQVFIPPVSASLRVTDGRVETTKASSGRALDIAASGDLLQQDPWGTVMSGRFKPLFVPVQPQIMDVSKVAAQVAPLLSAPVTVHVYDPVANEAQDWQITPQTVGEWITIVTRDGSREPAWDLDSGRVQAFLTEKASGLGGGRFLQADQAVPALVEAIKKPGGSVAFRVYHGDREHTIKAGETLSSVADDYGIPYPWIQRANPKLGDALRPGQVVTIPSQDALIPLPPVENKRIVVSIAEQKVWVYENGAEKWVWPASTGMSSSPTAPGIFQIQSHEKEAYAGNWNLWMPYFMGVYRPVPTVDFMNGFHGFPKRGGTQILWQNNLGRPVTYGCILISTENAGLLFDWAEDGVVVEIKR